MESTWVTKQLPVRDGLYAYTVLIRAPDDPERKPRPVGGQEDRTPHRTLAKMDRLAVRRAILKNLGYKQAKTMNRIGVELWDKTADILFGSQVEEVLWELVEEGVLEFTMEAPVLFRRVRHK